LFTYVLSSFTAGLIIQCRIAAMLQVHTLSLVRMGNLSLALAAQKLKYLYKPLLRVHDLYFL